MPDVPSMPAGIRPELTILVPLFNEAPVFPKLVDRLRSLLDRWDFCAEMLFVDDGSRDGTPDLLRELVAAEPRARALVLSRNFGHQAALSAGLEAARGKAVAILDADLQDPPELLTEFLARWREGHQVVYGIRRDRKEGILKRAVYALFYRVLDHLSAIPIPMDAGDFCLMDRRVVDQLVAMPERNRFLRGMRTWAGFRQVGVPYERGARAAGSPQYTWRKLFQLGLDGVLSFSHVPLRFATLAGILAGAGAFGLLLFYLAWWVSGASLAGRKPEDVGGFMTLTTLILAFSSMQFLFFGVLGEYLGRVFLEVKRRPGWIVAERLGFERNEPLPRMDQSVPPGG
jgi:dolichol-phosphate mannosyltransferase